MVKTEDKMGDHIPTPNSYEVKNYNHPVIKNHSVTTFTHVDDNTALQYLAKVTNFDEPLYDVVTTDAFTPVVKTVSKKLLRQKIVDVYCDLKQELKVLFTKFDGNVGITCDLWTSFDGEDRYVCVICHWVGEGWLEKRVIGFEILDLCDFGDVVPKMIQVLDEFGLKNKVGWISFDDGIGKGKCMEHLVGVFDFVSLEMFAHDRTYAHVVELCAQLVVDQLGSFICPIRELVKWFRFSSGKRGEFRDLCKRAGLKPRKFCLDQFEDWKSTLDHLKVVYRYKDVLTKLYNDCADHSPLDESQWDALSSIISLLEKFRDISDKFGWAYDASCHLVIQDCISIVRTLRIYESDPRFSSVAAYIRSKWLDVFPEIPTVYCVATILDPRIKVEGLRQLLVYYYETLGMNYNVDEKVAKAENALQQLHAHYSPSRKSETKMTSTSGEGNNNQRSSSLEFNVIRNVIKRKRVDDLGEYLFLQFDISDDDDEEYFEILQWWEKQKDALPVLSKIAKEVLCIPISATIPKPNCCPGKRVLDERRSRLKPSLIRVCICKKDWDLADEGLQNREDHCIDGVSVSSDSDADLYSRM